MKSLYVTSVERYSGKTAACLALGTRFQANGYKVGYLKAPQPATDASGRQDHR
jgi:BioD-like phosphotransacetylase family protein